jgi:hypothetical protein
VERRTVNAEQKRRRPRRCKGTVRRARLLNHPIANFVSEE